MNVGPEAFVNSVAYAYQAQCQYIVVHRGPRSTPQKIIHGMQIAKITVTSNFLFQEMTIASRILSRPMELLFRISHFVLVTYWVYVSEDEMLQEHMKTQPTTDNFLPKNHMVDPALPTSHSLALWPHWSPVRRWLRRKLPVRVLWGKPMMFYQPRETLRSLKGGKSPM